MQPYQNHSSQKLHKCITNTNMSDHKRYLQFSYGSENKKIVLFAYSFKNLVNTIYKPNHTTENQKL
jgi:hypothetical protein